MTERVNPISKELNGLFKSGNPFAIYRLPGDGSLHFLYEGQVECCETLSACVPGCFVMAPFALGHGNERTVVFYSANKRVIDLSGLETGDADGLDVADSPFYYGKDDGFEDYCEVFRKFKEKLADNSFRKLVLARSRTFGNFETDRVFDAYFRAVAKYRNSFVYMFFSAGTGLWMGATPEILLEACGDGLHTVALAGTRPLADWENNPLWDEKNIEEQEYVASYIEGLLSDLGAKYNRGETYTASAGNIVHLKTDFRFTVDKDRNPLEVVYALHPTPAVCGLPKNEALDFILKTERASRGYYAGFVGPFEDTAKFSFFVNLRCLNVSDKGLTLYAGGGILPGSEVEAEFKETENKMHTLLNIL